MFNLTVQDLEKYSTTAGIQGLAWSEPARQATDWRRERRWEMVELKDCQQWETVGTLQLRSCWTLMAQFQFLAGFNSICFPDGLDSKESACSAEDQGSIPESERSPGEGNGSPLQYSCLENPMHGGTWQPTVHGVAKSQT